MTLVYYDFNSDRKSTNIKRIIRLVLTDIICVCIGIYIYCLFQFILPRKIDTNPIDLPKATIQNSSENNTPAPVATQSPTDREDMDEGQWGAKFPDKFTTGEIIRTKNSYKSKDINISIKKISENQAIYFIADIYIRNIENFKRAFAKDTYGIGIADTTVNMARENNAILAISGDYYGAKRKGIVIKNGTLYRDSLFEDVLIMYNDGSMKTFTANEFNIDHILQNGAYQGWSFGPKLLDNGQPMEKFNSDVTPKNPRASIGYYEPGHYCFVAVDGRQDGYSKGLTLKELSQLFYKLGCKEAYNLDGGQTAVMAFNGEIANQPYQGGRKVSDIIYIAEK